MCRLNFVAAKDITDFHPQPGYSSGRRDGCVIACSLGSQQPVLLKDLESG